MAKQIIGLMLSVFLMGFSLGFLVCLRTLVKRAMKIAWDSIEIAKETSAHSKVCIDAMRDLETQVKPFLEMQHQPKPKSTVH